MRTEIAALPDGKDWGGGGGGGAGATSVGNVPFSSTDCHPEPAMLAVSRSRRAEKRREGKGEYDFSRKAGKLESLLLVPRIPAISVFAAAHIRGGGERHDGAERAVTTSVVLGSHQRQRLQEERSLVGGGGGERGCKRCGRALASASAWIGGDARRRCASPTARSFCVRFEQPVGRETHRHAMPCHWQGRRIC